MTAFFTETGFHIGYGLMLLGVVLLLNGFGVDAYLHSHDPSLAAKEGIFNLSNPGHLLVFIGLAVIIVGAAFGPYTRYVLPSRSPMLAMLAPAVAFGAALAISGAFATEVNDLSHDEASAHAAADAAPAHSTDASHTTDSAAAADPSHPHGMEHVIPENRGTVALVEATSHMPANNQAVTQRNLDYADKFLADARAATEKYKDVSIAEADGYFQITPDLPLIGAHFFHEGHDGLDPANPSNLLYTDDGNGGWRLAGMVYSLPKTLGDDVPPATDFGGLAQWHYHSNLCFLGGGMVATAPNEDACPGVFVAETGWLLHVWAWLDSPEGVFDHANSLLQ